VPDLRPFGELLAGLRHVQDLVAAADPPDDVAAAARDRLSEVAMALEPWATTELNVPRGLRHELPAVAECARPRDQGAGFCWPIMGRGSCVDDVSRDTVSPK